jgi:hypothetical protein
MLRDIKDTKIRKMIFCLFRYTDEKKKLQIFLLQFFIQNI